MMKLAASLGTVGLFLVLLFRDAHAQALQNETSCRLLTYIPFTDLRPGAPGNHANEGSYGYGFWPSQQALSKNSFSLLAAAEMARRDFNDRNAVLVEQLDALDDCPIRLADNSVYADSGYSRKKVVADYLARDLQERRDDDDKTTNPQTTSKTPFCTIVGPVETETHEGLSAVTETQNLPQLAYQSIQHHLSRMDLFPTFARVIPEGQDWGQTLAKAIHRDLWYREYLAIIYEPDYGDQFESPLEDAEDELTNFFTITEEVEEGSDESIYDALGEVVSEGYRTIMYIGDRFELLDDVARVADDLGLLGEGYFWILSGDAVPPAMMPTVRATPGSPLDKMLDGAAVFTNYDPFVYNPEGDRFLNHWRAQSADFVNHVMARQPRQGDGRYHYEASASYFQDQDPAEYSSFIYDAVMTAGISACHAAALVASADETAAAQPDIHFHEMLKTSFTGASGFMKFKSEDGEYSNTRDAESMTFGFHNIRPTPVGDDGKRGYNVVLFATYQQEHTYTNSDGEVEQGAWKLLPDAEFFFFGNTTVEPMPRRTVANANFLSNGIQRTGLTLFALSAVINLGSLAWLIYHREKRIVKAGQPEFLYVLCVGSLLVSTSLVFISFDENQGWSDQQLDRGCATFPWLFVIGYLTMYCALMSKLWRLSKLMQMRRQVVKVTHVLGPFAVLIVCSLAVLLTWQIQDPLQWKREVVNRDPLETYGECQVEGGSLLAYIVPLGFLIMIVTASTAIFAWKLKDVQSDLSASRWIFFGIFTHLQTWAVGIPVVVITDDTSRDAFYIMLAGLAFIFSTTMVAFVVWPKIFDWFRDTYLGGATTPKVQISTKQSSMTISGLDLPSASFKDFRQLSQGRRLSAGAAATSGAGGSTTRLLGTAGESALPSQGRQLHNRGGDVTALARGAGALPAAATSTTTTTTASVVSVGDGPARGSALLDAVGEQILESNDLSLETGALPTNVPRRSSTGELPADVPV